MPSPTKQQRVHEISSIAISRAVAKDELERLSRGLYCHPELLKDLLASQ
ncbi:type IV toxin-antitoxin system AbiEi family antitoxin domain-containing protein [Coraliomargarita algicola]|uniref:Type IV toxin-antitoxin system AbiEi family antitoxin domain-containing protein n=1 Tax=Coraliomargarita algicola TaxID=3092156 RepID=A0ABZ0RLR8_9BACT|nr:type IV toxin-antitoxin system AbiEi family antitoxin domain-containing protein [Coraliomargarita sp. J2-16]WPJ97151.1 type IV toxin-antitoxin system AbiEi family antitoxin domain-containing protein [Coraliomargarita sp. J2-16]